MLPVGTEDFRVLARVGDDDEMCRSLGENLFPELACSTAPLFREPEKSLVSSEARQGESTGKGKGALDSVELVL